MRKLIKIKTRDGLTFETDEYCSVGAALIGERVADNNIRSVVVSSMGHCGGDCGDCHPCSVVKEQAQ